MAGATDVGASLAGQMTQARMITTATAATIHKTRRSRIVLFPHGIVLGRFGPKLDNVQEKLLPAVWLYDALEKGCLRTYGCGDAPAACISQIAR